MDILKELFLGNINPQEQWSYNNKNYKKAIAEFNKRMEILDAELSGKSKKLLEDVLDADADMTSIAEAEKFKLGFRLGAQIMYACFCEK